MTTDETPHRIALFLKPGPKINRDRLAGILRYAAAKPNWEVRVMDDMTLSQPTWLADGFITGISTYRTYAGYLARCRRKHHAHIPIVAFDWHNVKGLRPDAEVRTDDAAVGRAAAKTFLSKEFSSFVYIPTWETYELWHSDMREGAFAQALVKRGKSMAKIPLLDSSGDVITIEELGRRIKAIPKPCAILAYADTVARFVLDACRLAEVSVPEQVAILGVDDITEITENTRPTLSSIRLDFESAGYTAAELLDGLYANGKSAKLLRHTASELTVAERDSTGDVYGSRRIVFQTLDYIRRHYNENIRTSDIARALNVSPRLVEMRVRAALDCSIREKITEIRIGHAAELLKKSRRSVLEIALDCGYTSAEGLAAAFRRLHDISPAAFRTAQGRRSD